jgi:cellulose synthase/poly-beta-1,6-N-acetylglucosamine synthase-like glycosyltransferase
VLHTTLWAITIAFSFLYIIYFILYIKYWTSLPSFSIEEKDYKPRTFISVLIPVRDEEDTVLPCIHSILNGNYPQSLFEIIVIDDHSTDNTPQYIRDLHHPQVHLVELRNHVQPIENQPFKKKAIEAAIGQAKGDLIVTTDGDCVVQAHWLNLIAAFYETKGKRFIAAPVNFHNEESFFERFQSLDYIGMMGITAAGVQGNLNHICNGANLAYEKKLFHDVGGFKGIDHVASGDDVLLMQKVVRFYPEAVGFLKNYDATVFTKAKPTVKEFYNQRMRWATKSSSYTEFVTVFQLVVVFTFCVGILASICFSLFYDIRFILFPAVFLFIKLLFDYIFLRMMTQFFRRTDLMKDFLLSQLCHILYIVIIGFWSNIRKKYVWKGRTVK